MTANHFTKMCKSTKDKFKSDFDMKRQRPKRQYPPKQANAVQRFTTTLDQSEEEWDDEYVVHSFSAYAVTKESSTNDKYFTWLPILVKPNKTVKVLMQVDSAATCNTLPSEIYKKIAGSSPPKQSKSRILPYSGGVIHPVGKQTFACEGANSFETLEFEIISSNDIPGKPALLSGRDSELLGLIKFHKDRVFASATSDVKPPDYIPQPHTHMVTTDQASPTGLFRQPDLSQLIPGKITKSQLTDAFADNFQGLGKVGKPVQFAINPDVTPRQAGIHRIPVAKLEKVKTKLEEMVQAQKLTKVEAPTDWSGKNNYQMEPPR
jgi:hypothetical protein